jgi:hypothetical protein
MYPRPDEWSGGGIRALVNTAGAGAGEIFSVLRAAGDNNASLRRRLYRDYSRHWYRYRTMKTRTVKLAGYGPFAREQQIVAPYFEPIPGEPVESFTRHIGKVLEEQEKRLERLEYYLADIYDRFRKAGQLSDADTESLSKINELMSEIEARRGWAASENRETERAAIILVRVWPLECEFRQLRIM